MTKTKQTKKQTKKQTGEFRADLCNALPALRDFALSLARNGDRARDLVQSTVVRALANSDRFAPGTNFDAWVFTIMRNQHIDNVRRSRREVSWDPGDHLPPRMPAVAPNQEHHVMLQDLQQAMDALNGDQQEVLRLVVFDGSSYADAARISGCAVGTIRSRLARARQTLDSMLSGNAGQRGGAMPPLSLADRRMARPE